MQHIHKDRLITVDALRGFALLGIMLAHFIFWYTAGPLPQEIYSKYQGLGSTIANLFTELFVSGKFFAFFSFLFGLSFYLQMRGLEQDQRTFISRYAWRLTLLMVIGVIHHAMWQGDILSIYVPLGFVLLAMRKLNNKWILILGILLAINVPGKIYEAANFLLSKTGAPNFGDFAKDASQYNEVITKGSWLTIFKYNLSRFITKFQFQVDSGRIYITLGFFLLGTYVGRKKWFETLEDTRPTIKKICKRSALIMVLALAAGLGMFGLDAALKLGWQQNPVAGYIFSIFYQVYNAAMVIFFISGLTLLMYRTSWQKLFYPMAAVGKMALTSYITQTVFGLLLFYGVGFGLYGKTSPGTNFIIAIGFFVLQVFFSRWYLQYFNYGPLEWLWRSGTYLKWQSFVKRKNEVSAPIIPIGEPALSAIPSTLD
ncbi:MAG: DUF418 domain-containing protein [Chitinophagaceae bacterium]|nr:DUF418 domain-containing protein [Chitinophagaceae bacterium]